MLGIFKKIFSKEEANLVVVEIETEKNPETIQQGINTIKQSTAEKPSPYVLESMQKNLSIKVKVAHNQAIQQYQLSNFHISFIDRLGKANQKQYMQAKLQKFRDGPKTTIEFTAFPYAIKKLNIKAKSTNTYTVQWKKDKIKHTVLTEYYEDFIIQFLPHSSTTEWENGKKSATTYDDRERLNHLQIYNKSINQLMYEQCKEYVIKEREFALFKANQAISVQEKQEAKTIKHQEKKQSVMQSLRNTIHPHKKSERNSDVQSRVHAILSGSGQNKDEIDHVLEKRGPLNAEKVLIDISKKSWTPETKNALSQVFSPQQSGKRTAQESDTQEENNSDQGEISQERDITFISDSEMKKILHYAKDQGIDEDKVRTLIATNNFRREIGRRPENKKKKILRIKFNTIKTNNGILKNPRIVLIKDQDETISTERYADHNDYDRKYKKR